MKCTNSTGFCLLFPSCSSASSRKTGDRYPIFDSTLSRRLTSPELTIYGPNREASPTSTTKRRRSRSSMNFHWPVVHVPCCSRNVGWNGTVVGQACAPAPDSIHTLAWIDTPQQASADLPPSFSPKMALFLIISRGFS
ncbi:hypothetical protein N658DRAFT_131820 [Parathielavia hyrcaniae]|uniref:Uncharacterized protein n=1 Tax=Parathielavia hyrcaniae TaxID=113614 RepID=A0AAN6QCJ9_9PEZI|nr:hypothetical protein N658DRAFT_131820 [Parathielavia hyrcaniae]